MDILNTAIDNSNVSFGLSCVKIDHGLSLKLDQRIFSKPASTDGMFALASFWITNLLNRLVSGTFLWIYIASEYFRGTVVVYIQEYDDSVFGHGMYNDNAKDSRPVLLFGIRDRSFNSINVDRFLQLFSDGY